MAIPRSTRSWRNESGEMACTVIPQFLEPGRISILIIIRGFRGGVVHFHARVRLERAQNFVAPGDDLIPLGHAVQNLDISNTDNSSRHGDKLSPAVPDDEDPLY